MIPHRSRTGVARLGILAFLALAVLFVTGSCWLRAHRHRLLDHRLIAAIERRDTRMARLLLVLGADPNARRWSGTWPSDALDLAAEYGEAHVIDDLILRGAHPTDYWVLPGPLQMAAGGGHVDAVMVLLRHGERANTPVYTDDGSTPLIAVTLGGHVEAMAVLLRAGADPNQADGRGGTPLSYAALAPRWPCREISEETWLDEVRLLLTMGADVRRAGGEYDNRAALGIALSHGDLRMAALLEQAGATAPDHLVWADVRQRRYYLRGWPEFRKAQPGRLMYDAEARALGYNLGYHE